MDEREVLEESLALLRHTFEELKEIRDSLDTLELVQDGGIRLFLDARIQDLIWRIGKQLGEF